MRFRSGEDNTLTEASTANWTDAPMIADRPTQRFTFDIPLVEGVPLMLMTGEEPAEAMRYNGVTSGFRAWCRTMGISTVRGRANLYDPKHVRDRLNAAYEISGEGEREALSYVEQRRRRRGA